MESENNRRASCACRARGVVYDRRGEILIDNRASFDVVFVPEDAPDRKGTLKRLAGVLGETETQLHERLRAPSKRPQYEGIVVRRDLDWNDVVRVETHQLELPGVSLQVVPRRAYPFGPLAAHLFGYVGEVSEKELQGVDTATVRQGDRGKASLEKAWDVEPRPRRRAAGGSGRARASHAVLDESPTSGRHGDADHRPRNQEVAGARSGTATAPSRARPAQRGGAGDGLAPSYDPNIQRGLVEESSLMQDGRRSSTAPCTGSSRLGPPSRWRWRPARSRRRRQQGSSVSCGGGTHSATISSAAGGRAATASCRSRRSSVVRRLLLRSGRGSDRQPGQIRPEPRARPADGIQPDHEKAGTIPTRVEDAVVQAAWYPGETLSVAIGQGYVTATPLQMATMVATIANAARYRPHYVSGWTRPTAASARSSSLRSWDGVAVTWARARRHARRGHERSPRGRRRLPGVTVAGKTGTAQVVRWASARARTKAHTRDHAWFILSAYEAPDRDRVHHRERW